MMDKNQRFKVTNFLIERANRMAREEGKIEPYPPTKEGVDRFYKDIKFDEKLKKHKSKKKQLRLIKSAQGAVLFLLAIVLVVMFLNPPFEIHLGKGIIRDLGYSEIWEVPMYNSGQGYIAGGINVTLLGLQFIVSIITGGLVYFSLEHFKNKQY